MRLLPVDSGSTAGSRRRATMTRIRTGTFGLRQNTVPNLYATIATDSTAMESAIMDTADALASSPAEMVDVQEEDVSSSIHPHQSAATVPLMNEITVTLAGTTAVDEEDGDNKYDVADKDESDLPVIDFASATNHNTTEPQATPPDATDDKMRCYGTNVAEDNEANAMMIVDSVGATETAHCSSNSSTTSHSSSSSSSTSSNSNHSSSSSSSSSSGSSTTGSSATHPEPDEVEAEEEEDDEEEDEEEGVHHVDGQELHGEERVATVVDESTSVDKLHMMQTDDDPLLQETINALMNGTDGIEVVNTTDHHTTTTVVSADADIAAVVAAEMSTRPANDELETDRNYECTYCGKLFTRSNTLSYHLKVHTGERPFKCKHCSKAFREQYRLMKHLKTHSKYRNRRLERGPPEHTDRVVTQSVRAHLHRGASAALLVSANGLTVGTGEEDYATGDSERFFKSYDMPDGTVAMKLEPDISLTEDADVTEVGPDAMLTTEVVDAPEEPISEAQMDANDAPEVVLADGNDIRYQIIEERIKSLQREVHLVNQNLNRVESKVDGLTRIISLFIGKLEDETDLVNHVAQQQVQQQQQVLSTVSGETGGSMVPVTSLTVVAQPQQPTASIPSSSATSPTVQPKAIFLTSTSANPPSVQSQTAPQTAHVYTTANLSIASVSHSGQSTASIVPHQPAVQSSVTKEVTAQIGSTHYYQFAEPPSMVHPKTEPPATPVTTTLTVPSPSPTPPLSQTQQHLALTSGGTNGNQLLDSLPDIPELPIRTVSDFLDLNDHCTDNEQFLLQMMIRLHQEIHNSQPFQRNIKRMMEALVTYEVLCQFSWSGKSAINGQYTKYVFGNSLGIIDLLTKTLNLGKSAEEAETNQKPIFAAIQSFIKHSRQNMIRDSRKRREPMRSSGSSMALAAGDVVAAMAAVEGVATTTATISYHVNGTDRLQIKQIKSERHQHHHQTELVHPF
ncbi:uncharacterized protein LOC128724843 [Anopheles nili]|uniref:uncharacterized protein LOC128724843 n=1 Tax=Anopheles nili TaxID=185578 RepID=UPI00237B8927|nr:uncharacterized protein LOC128724843 [Anopheles nili]